MEMESITEDKGFMGNMMTKMMNQAQDQMKKNFDKCAVCQKSLFGLPWLALHDSELGIIKLCQDCQMNAAYEYVKKYRERLGADK